MFLLYAHTHIFISFKVRRCQRRNSVIFKVDFVSDIQFSNGPSWVVVCQRATLSLTSIYQTKYPEVVTHSRANGKNSYIDFKVRLISPTAIYQMHFTSCTPINGYSHEWCGGMFCMECITLHSSQSHTHFFGLFSSFAVFVLVSKMILTIASVKTNENERNRMFFCVTGLVMHDF